MSKPAPRSSLSRSHSAQRARRGSTPATPHRCSLCSSSCTRKGVGFGSVAHPRLSVKREDASKCEAVLIPLVLEGNVLCEDRACAPQLVPLGLLGCKVDVALLSEGGAYHGDTYTLGEAVPTCGGEVLQTLHLTDSMFAKEAMLSGGSMAFEQMKMTQLKEELGARGSSRSGLKASLQRRLHGLLVQAAIERRAAEREEAGEAWHAGGEGAGASADASAGRRVRARR